MGQVDILNVFLENPTKNFQIRGIARYLNIPKTTISYHVNKFLKDGIIIKEDKGVFPSFRAHESSENYRFIKKQESVRKIMEFGFLDYIEKELNPKCVVLFGSFAKGEYDAGSDIDIFVQAKEAKVDVARFE
jgi:DNA-binding Lrp family transcriptional regulator